MATNIIISIISSFFIFNNYQSKYFRFGWSNNFIFVSVVIDTPLKYIFLCIFIILINIADVLTNEIANPILYFSTYNPDRKIINDFTRNELQIYSNIMYFIQILKKCLQVLITISQIDIAFISAISSQISGMLTINFLLNEKQFNTSSDIQMDYKTNENTPLHNKIVLPV